MKNIYFTVAHNLGYGFFVAKISHRQCVMVRIDQIANLVMEAIAYGQDWSNCKSCNGSNNEGRFGGFA